MPDTVDARIPLQAGQGPFGPDITKMLSAQDFALKLQQNRQAAQAQNFLRQRYADPNSVDQPTGMLKPSVIPQVGQIDPGTAAELSQSYQAAQSLIARTRLLADKNQKDQLWRGCPGRC